MRLNLLVAMETLRNGAKSEEIFQRREEFSVCHDFFIPFEQQRFAVVLPFLAL